MFYRTYISFQDKELHFLRENEPTFSAPPSTLSSLVFGTIDIDWNSHRTAAKQLLEHVYSLPVYEERTIQQGFDDPDHCTYFLTADFYHRMAADVKAVCPGLFYLLEDTCLQAWREYKRRCLHNEHILIDYNTRSFESGELLPPPRGVLAEQMHLTSMQIVADIMDQYCRSFPEIPANMQVYLQKGTPDAELSEAAKYVLELFVEMLDTMIRFQQDLDDMIDFALCSRENQPRKNPSVLLLNMQDTGYEPYTRNAKRLDHIHSKITRYTNHPTSKRKPTLVTATSYASDDISVLIFLTFEQMCLQNMLIKHCHNCGGLFVPYSNTAKYCQRILDPTTGGTCKELVSRKNYETSVQNDEAKNMIRKRKNTFRMQRTRINPASYTIMQPYYDYLELANAALKEYQAGQISFEELEVQTRLPE